MSVGLRFRGFVSELDLEAGWVVGGAQPTLSETGAQT